MREGVRTFILVLLFLFAIGFIVWTQNAYDQNFLETL